ncbi:MAG: Tol-Pal system beta propeller repeat protein TolB, partial [Myxococcota bacterium]
MRTLVAALLMLGAVLVGLFGVSPAYAGAPIVIGPGQNDFPLGLPYAKGDASEAKAVWEVVRRDLELTGYFRLLDPKATIDQGGLEPGSFDFQDWRTLRAAAVAKIAVKSAGSGITAEVWIYDVNSGEKRIAKRFSGSTAQARTLGHALAREILLSLTGDPGFFGSKIAAVRSRGNKEVVVFDVDGQSTVSVTRNGSINLSPAWSPDGSYLAWTSYKRNNPDVYVKQLATGRTRVLSANPGINIGAAYSPDGSKVALSRSRNGDADIFVLDARTGKVLKQLTRGGGIDVGPSWSPDGSQITFSSERSGGSQIFVMPSSGGEARRISRQGTFNTDPV